MSSNFKDLPRNLVSKVKKPFTRSRLPSRAPAPVPDGSPVGPTQGGNDEGVSWISCSSNALIVGLGGPPTANAASTSEGDCSPLQRKQLIDRIEHIQTPPWDGWQVDQSSVADLVRWTIWLRSHRPLQRPSPINLSRPGRPSFDLPFDASTPSHTGSPDSV